mgnify:CR=1 FL=1
MKKYDENFFYDNTSQNNIEELILDDEQLLWRGKPKKKAYILNSILKMLPLALIWLAIDGSFIGLMIGFGVFDALPTIAIIFLCVFFLFHLFPVWLWLKNVITANKEYKHLEYAFTNSRIIIKSGIIGIDINNIYYSEIENINLKVGIIDKMLKVGDIYITSNNKAQVLWDIENPYIISNKLQKIVSDIKTDIQYPNALRPETNSGYKTKLADENFNNSKDI